MSQSSFLQPATRVREDVESGSTRPANAFPRSERKRIQGHVVLETVDLVVVEVGTSPNGMTTRHHWRPVKGSKWFEHFDTSEVR